MILDNTIYMNKITGITVTAIHTAGSNIVKLTVVNPNQVPYLRTGSKYTTSYLYFTKVYVAK